MNQSPLQNSPPPLPTSLLWCRCARLLASLCAVNEGFSASSRVTSWGLWQPASLRRRQGSETARARGLSPNRTRRSWCVRHGYLSRWFFDWECVSPFASLWLMASSFVDTAHLVGNCGCVVGLSSPCGGCVFIRVCMSVRWDETVVGIDSYLDKCVTNLTATGTLSRIAKPLER